MTSFRKSWKIIAFLVCVVVADIIAIGIYFKYNSSSSSSSTTSTNSTSTLDPPDVVSPQGPSTAVMGVYSKSAVVAAEPCASYAQEIMAQGGNAVDAAITALLCDGLEVMQAMGVGGGFFMTIYNKTTNEVISLSARESAPGAATQDMYVNNTDGATFGATAVAVPGELKGYQEAYLKYGGGVPWASLFEPTIKMCEDGYAVNRKMASAFVSTAAKINRSTTFKPIILNYTNGEFPLEGDILKLPLLATTLRLIANSSNMAEELYNGSLTEQFVADIQAGGGIITVADMNNYTVQWKTPYNASLSDGLTLYSAALPGSGILVAFIFRLLDGFLQYANSDIERSQMIIEAFKHAYGRRTDLSDEDYPGNKTALDEVISVLTSEESILAIRELIKLNWTSNDVYYYGADYTQNEAGTNHIVVVDQEGNAVSATSTINTYFGSTFVSTSTGILLNDEMDDFSTPGLVNAFGVSPSSANFIEPYKRPLSSMCPTIVLDSAGDVRLLVGAAGGSTITTITTLVAIRNLWLGKNIKEALDEPRFHHQLVPMYITYEYGILQEMLDAWHSYGHNTSRLALWPTDYLAVATGIARIGDNLTACYDWRRPGQTSGL